MRLHDLRHIWITLIRINRSPAREPDDKEWTKSTEPGEGADDGEDGEVVSQLHDDTLEQQTRPFLFLLLSGVVDKIHGASNWARNA